MQKTRLHHSTKLGGSQTIQFSLLLAPPAWLLPAGLPAAPLPGPSPFAAAFGQTWIP